MSQCSLAYTVIVYDHYPKLLYLDGMIARIIRCSTRVLVAFLVFDDICMDVYHLHVWDNDPIGPLSPFSCNPRMFCMLV